MHDNDHTPLPFDVSQLATMRDRGARERVRLLEQEMRDRTEREESVYRDIRAIKWTLRLAAPVLVALLAILPWALPWMVKQTVRDSLIELGVLKTVGAWGASK